MNFHSVAPETVTDIVKFEERATAVSSNSPNVQVHLLRLHFHISLLEVTQPDTTHINGPRFWMQMLLNIFNKKGFLTLKWARNFVRISLRKVEQNILWFYTKNSEARARYRSSP